MGDPAVLDAGMVRLAGDRVASRAIDNRVGAFTVIEALRLVATGGGRAGAVAVATAQEEIGYSGGGARTSAFGLAPDVALVVDVTHATDVPEVEKSEGRRALPGRRFQCSRAAPPPIRPSSSSWPRRPRPTTSRTRSRRRRCAPAPMPMPSTWPAAGIPTGLISVPNRYMHSPSEMVSISDLFQTARLLAAFVARLDSEVDFGRGLRDDAALAASHFAYIYDPTLTRFERRGDQIYDRRSFRCDSCSGNARGRTPLGRAPSIRCQKPVQLRRSF